MLGRFEQVDPTLAKRVSDGIGVPVPSEPEPSDAVPPAGKTVIDRSPALSMANTIKGNIQGRRIAILVADGVNEDQVQMLKDGVVKGGAQATVIAKVLGTVKGASGEDISVDKSALTVASIMFDAVYVPGGARSVQALKGDGDALHFVQEAYRHCKTIGASGEGIELLVAAGLPTVTADGKASAVSEPGILTTVAPKLAAFVDDFVGAVGQHRHWARANPDHVPA